jgi:hypothetical protein
MTSIAASAHESMQIAAATILYYFDTDYNMVQRRYLNSRSTLAGKVIIRAQLTFISICKLYFLLSGTNQLRTSSVVACKLTANAVRILVSSIYRLMLGTMPAVDTVTLSYGTLDIENDMTISESYTVMMVSSTGIRSTRLSLSSNLLLMS